MKNWYSIKAKADKPEDAEISIYDEIGVWGVTAKAFISDLQNLGDVKNITLSVNSPGGSVFDGLAIYNALKGVRDKGTKITAKVMGIAASAASFIVMVANEIEMPENSMMMVHYASGLAWGNAETMRETAEILDKIDASIVGIYMARTGKDEADVRALLAAESYLTAAEAKEKGFADTVTENVKATASFEVDRLPANVQALFKACQTPAEPEPANEDDDESPEDAFADQVLAKAKAAGFENYAPLWALNATTLADVEARINEAREIKAFCAVAKLPEKADSMIAQGMPVAKVRETLITARAERDEATHTDTAPRNNTNSPITSKPSAFKTADVWASRRKSQQGA